MRYVGVLWVCVWVCGCLWVAVLGDICDRRDRRTDRVWKGDVGDLEMFPGGRVRDRLQLKHRVRRFLSFPTGSVLTVTPKLTIPFVDRFDGYITGEQLYAFPIDLNLPNATLRFRTRDEEEMTQGYDDPMSYTSYSSSRYGRSLDNQRAVGFNLLQKLMEMVGLAGHECVLRAVCEVAERPVDHLGVTGEIINLFFSAGYGGGSKQIEEYVEAEVAGRVEGECEARYYKCPYSLAGMVEASLSYLHTGLATVNHIQVT